MFTTAIVAAAVAASVVSAAPIESRGKPTNWATGYLEPYDTYHLRYIALDCQDKHNTTFFDQCCHPLLATQTLQADRPAQCDPSKAQYSSASSVIVSNTATSDDGADSAFATATSSVESVWSSAEATATSTNNDWTTALASSTSAPSTQNNYAAPQTSTSTQQAQPTQSNNNNGGGNVNYGGFATYFYQGGVAGACGQVHSDYDLIAAIDIDRYGNTGDASSLCGQSVTITNTQNGNQVTVVIADACPSCTNSNSIDLSVGAFEALASLGAGEVPISWVFDN